MHSDNIENKLRELEAASAADLSAMDEHWKAMEATLTAVVIKPKSGKKILTAGAGAAVIAISTILYFSFSKNQELVSGAMMQPKTSEAIIARNDSDTVSKLPVIVAANPVVIAGNPVIVTANPVVIATTPVILSVPVINIDAKQDQSDKPLHVSLSNNNNGNISPAISLDPESKPDTAKKTTADRMLKLQSLFEELSKKEQQFFINNKRDTLLFAKEGLALYIPAQSFFGADSIVIGIKEFYSRADILLNRLTTISNGEELISGGMFNISATKNGKELAVNKSMPVKVFIPNLTGKDSMQIFYAGESTNLPGTDTTGVTSSKKLNWQLSTVRIDSPVLKMFVRAIDLRDEPQIVSTDRYISFGRKSKAIFRRSINSVYTKAELKTMLQKKYGDYYDIIKVKGLWKRNLLFQESANNSEYDSYYQGLNSRGVGDTAEMLPFEFRYNKLKPIDTIYKIVNWIYKGTRSVRLAGQINLSAEAKKMIGEKYSIELDKLGFINCDKFWKYKGDRINVNVDLKDTAYSYCSMLIFDKIKSMMSAVPVNNTIVYFPAIPAHEPAKLVCIGINQKGESVIAVKNLNRMTGFINDLKFEKMSAEEIRSEIGAIDKQ